MEIQKQDLCPILCFGETHPFQVFLCWGGASWGLCSSRRFLVWQPWPVLVQPVSCHVPLPRGRGCALPPERPQAELDAEPLSVWGRARAWSILTQRTWPHCPHSCHRAALPSSRSTPGLCPPPGPGLWLCLPGAGSGCLSAPLPDWPHDPELLPCKVPMFPELLHRRLRPCDGPPLPPPPRSATSPRWDSFSCCLCITSSAAGA